MHRLILIFFHTDKSKKKNKKKSLGEVQVEMKCQLEPSDELIKLEYKDWPLLFKVNNLSYKYNHVHIFLTKNELYCFRILIKCLPVQNILLL